MGTNTMALIQTCQIQATAVKLQCCHIWQVELSALSLLHISFNTHLSNRFSCSTQFFLSKITLGRALLESWGVACATTEKHWCPVSTFAYFRGTAFQGKPAKITFVVFMGQHWCFLLWAAAHHLTDNILVWMCPYTKLMGRGTEMVSALETCWGKKNWDIQVAF